MMIATIHRIDRGPAETSEESAARRVQHDEYNKKYWQEHPDEVARISAEFAARQAAIPPEVKEREATDRAEWRGKVADWETDTRHPECVTRWFWYTHGGRMSSSFELAVCDVLEAACEAADVALRAKGWPIPEYESYVVKDTTERPDSPSGCDNDLNDLIELAAL